MYVHTIYIYIYLFILHLLIYIHIFTHIYIYTYMYIIYYLVCKMMQQYEEGHKPTTHVRIGTAGWSCTSDYLESH